MLERRRDETKKDRMSILWFFKFLFQGVISHTALMLSIMTIMNASDELAILNDSIGILVLSQLNIIGSKLFLEDFKIDFNKLYTDDNFL